MDVFRIDGKDVCIEDVINVARHNFKVEITSEVESRVILARDMVDSYVKSGRIEYGITTGFGKFSDIIISKEDTKKLQYNLIVSHACGVGDEFPEEIVRGMMFLRAISLSKGFSGIRKEVLGLLIEMLNRGVHPVVYQKGSLGASGDLVPLAHMSLVMLGLGDAYYKNKRMTGGEALKLAGLSPIELVEKEGLALINGTQAMTSVGTLAVYDAITLLKSSDIIGAMTLEALRGIENAFYKQVHDIRPHRGQGVTASNILKIIEGSELITKQGEIRVQDAYTLRCIPQIHGASKDAIEFVKKAIEIEINSVTDNPLIFTENDCVISAGNFHGQPIALPMDFLGIALAEIANVSERRVERLVNSQLNDFLPFLTPNGGLNSGFMIAQYAAASLVSENKILAHPASVDSIPSSANQEDHVSMGTIAARKASEILKNSAQVLAIELLASAQALYFRGDVKMGEGTRHAYLMLRDHIKPLIEDRVMQPDIAKATELILSEQLVDKVEQNIGKLQI